VCGFAGEFVFPPASADAAIAEAMAETLRHRGPDEAARFVSSDGRCAIAVRRLAVIDPAGSHQPMTCPDGSVTVAFNGEIYNFRQLRARLADRGVRFRTDGDTEVLLHLYHQYGPEMVGELRGMFAFALYDADEGRLLLARDRLGQKPLWYALASDRVVFGSEPKALLEHPNVDRSMDCMGITYFLTMGYIPSPRTAWTGIRKLPPGHVLLADQTIGEPAQYWSPAPAQVPSSPEDQCQLVRRAIHDSVEARMIADVPLGALLSGGIDSSIVVALMSRIAGRAGGVRTFTAGFEQEGFDERPAARRVADHCRTDHTELLVRPEAASALDDLVAMYDEPFADSSALPTWLICRAAREHVTVALAGDGGDEVFGGYDRYRAIQLAATIRPLSYFAVRLGSMLAGPFARHDERSRLRRWIRFADALPHPLSVQYFMYRRLFGPEDLLHLFTEDFAAELDVYSPAEWFCELYEKPEVADEATRAQYHDLHTYLPDDLLVKADIASMAVSLELRAPMLDHDVVGIGLGLPLARKLDRRQGKKVLKEAFADMLPAEVFERPKRGFGVPLGDWMRNELLGTLRETLLDRGLLERGIFRPEALHGLINDHVKGRGDHRHRLWALLVLARWLERQEGAGMGCGTS